MEGELSFATQFFPLPLQTFLQLILTPENFGEPSGVEGDAVAEGNTAETGSAPLYQQKSLIG